MTTSTSLHQQWTVQLTVVPEPVLVARVAVLLRKYDLTVLSLTRQQVDHDQETLTLHLENQRDNVAVAMKKLERLIPVVTLSYQLTSA